MIILHYHHNTTAYRRKNRINFAIYQTFSRNNVLSEGHTLKKRRKISPCQIPGTVGENYIKIQTLASLWLLEEHRKKIHYLPWYSARL